MNNGNAWKEDQLLMRIGNRIVGSKPVQRARLIYNPTSGREEMKRRLSDILARLEQGGLETSCHATVGAGDATLAAAEAIDRGFDLIIAAGGDGTLNEVISGMAVKEQRPPLGILPLGTTNDFARALGIPRHWEQACDIILRRQTRPIDIGRMNDRFFINIAGGGSMTELTYEVPSKLKTMLGQLAYYMKGIEKLPRFRPIHLSIRTDEGEMEGEFMLFLIANSNSVGGFEKLAPQALMDDGLFDVLLLRRSNLADFIRIASAALRGEHISDPRVVYFQTRRIEVTSEDYTQLNLDGEYGGTLPCRCTILPSHLQVIHDAEGLYKGKTKIGARANDETEDSTESIE